ncbi:hypothetical protein [Asticcacaulis benevestitus]|uniref:Uncharacterized protein n=1 Tax=Asticcacaulis benevestitus DSM 16100 = ATCC BAA-896 TaxID=1121022 RepID=V4P8P8_9CAUL|nr:hypothetical protein [Asticcacaulis benevestitus]ESQ81595.1 hypothetical protein ABENE_21730 [Asticcacaulis benevestitus DSM 16100 = ATCC BAA-896]
MDKRNAIIDHVVDMLLFDFSLFIPLTFRHAGVSPNASAALAAYNVPLDNPRFIEGYILPPMAGQTGQTAQSAPNSPLSP